LITAIIFSRDRAAQLHLLLESIRRNATGIFDIHINYKFSHVDYNDAYSLLSHIDLGKKYPANWVYRINLKQDILNILKNSSREFVCFLTDDSVIYRDISSKYSSIISPFDKNVCCFSLRLGLNTTTQYTFHTTQPPLQNYIEFNDDIISWDWRYHPPYQDYGYPMSIDGHIFRIADMIRYIEQIDFDNPNDLEGALGNLRNQLQPRMVSFKQSALVGIPVNRVQNMVPNLFGIYHGVPAEELNKQFLAGKCIDLDGIDFSNVYGAHQEFPFKFKKLENTYC
jgi:hypothetical protein